MRSFTADIFLPVSERSSSSQLFYCVYSIEIINLVHRQVMILNYSQNNDHMDMAQPSDRLHKPKTSTKQLELHVASVYCEIAEMIQQKPDLEIEMPAEVPTAIERVNLMKSVLAYLLDRSTGEPRARHDCSYGEDNEGDNKLACGDCQNYEKNLQKLESEVRNHIRTHQHLKIYQDNLEQKIQEYKKEKKQSDKKYQALKKKYEQAKQTITANSDRASKVEQQNQRLRAELKQAKLSIKPEEPKKPMTRYESNKQNLSDWRNNMGGDSRERVSAEKRPESTERLRTSINVRSTKGIPISSKIVQEKAKEEKARALKNRLGF